MLWFSTIFWHAPRALGVHTGRVARSEGEKDVPRDYGGSCVGEVLVALPMPELL